MPGGREIRAGKAYVELGVKDKLLKGLKDAGRRVLGFAAGIAKMSAAVGAAAAAGAVTAMKAFADMGSELNDASARTGIAVESLSAYKYAADQTSSSLEGFELGLRKMQKTIAGAVNGEKAATAALDELGLSAQQLKGMSPEKQFETIAAAIAAIEDPTMRAAAAQKLFGRGMTELLPMIQDLAALKQEAADAGLIVSSEDAASADDFGDALSLVWKQAKMVAFYVGNGLADAFMEHKDSIVGAMKAAIDWAKNSRTKIRDVVNALASGLSWIKGKFLDLHKAADDALGGVIGALESGQFKVAAELAVAQLKIAWLGLKDWFSELWNDIGNSMVETMIRSVAAAKEALLKLEGQRQKTVNSVGDAAVLELKIAQADNARDSLEMMKVNGTAEDVAKARDKAFEAAQQLQDTIRQVELGQSEIDPATQEKIDALNKWRDAQLKALDQIAQKQDELEKNRLGEEVLRLQEEQRRLRLRGQQNAGIGAMPNIPSRRQLMLRLELPEVPDPDEITDLAGLNVASRGTFNAAAAQGLEGGPGASMKDVAKATKDTAKNTAEIARNTREGSITFSD